MSPNLGGRIPVIKKPFSDRFLWVGVTIFLVLVGAVIYGFYRRIRIRQAHAEQQQIQTVSADAAQSNRVHLEGPNSLNGLPVTQPSTLPTPANPPPPIRPNVGAPASARRYTSGSRSMTHEEMQEGLQAAAMGRRLQREQDAIDGPTGAGEQGSSTPAVGVNRTAFTSGSAPLESAAVVPGSGVLPGGFGGAQSYRAQNAQEEKRRFANGSDDADPDYLTTVRTAPASRWVVQRGTVIPAALPSKLTSDLPGDLIAEVVRDVYDSPTQSYVEIPAGSRLVGEYNSSVSYGQNRVQVIWTAIYFPDGSFIDLDRMSSHAADGSVGLKDQVDNHWKRVIGGVALSSLLAAGLQISQNRTTSGNVLTYPSTGQEAAAAIGTQAAQLGEQITSRNLNVQPTLKIRPGEIFAVSVKKDIVFSGPY